MLIFVGLFVGCWRCSEKGASSFSGRKRSKKTPDAQRSGAATKATAVWLQTAIALRFTSAFVHPKEGLLFLKKKKQKDFCQRRFALIVAET